MSTTRAGYEYEPKISYWSCRDDLERLSDEDMDEAIEAYLDDLWERDQEWASYASYLPETLSVYGWKRIKIKPEMLWEPLEDVLERLDEEFGDPDGEGFQITDKMKEAQQAFLATVAAEYKCWACEVAITKEIDPVAWIKEHRPDWMKDK